MLSSLFRVSATVATATQFRTLAATKSRHIPSVVRSIHKQFQLFILRTNYNSLDVQSRKSSSATNRGAANASAVSGKGKLRKNNKPQGAKRTKLKKGRVTPDEPNLFDGDGVCAAYCVNNTVPLNRIMRQIKATSFTARKRGRHIRYSSNVVKLMSDDVLHITYRKVGEEEVEEEDDPEDGHLFLFESGAMVIWGLPLDLRKQFFEMIRTFQLQSPSSYSNKINLDTRDFEHEFRYSHSSTAQSSSFHNDEITISSPFDVANLLALSYGLAQSVRLLIYEEVVHSLILRTQSLPNELAQHAHVKLSHRDLKRLIGELLAAKYSLNLLSDILDTPEYFWQHPDLERLHFECTTQVELRQRVKILDTRTEVIKDALATLNNELSASSSDRVERAILFLIGVEVAIEVAKAFVN